MDPLAVKSVLDALCNHERVFVSLVPNLTSSLQQMVQVQERMPVLLLLLEVEVFAPIVMEAMTENSDFIEGLLMSETVSASLIEQIWLLLLPDHNAAISLFSEAFMRIHASELASRVPIVLALLNIESLAPSISHTLQHTYSAVYTSSAKNTRQLKMPLVWDVTFRDTVAGFQLLQHSSMRAALLPQNFQNAVEILDYLAGVFHLASTFRSTHAACRSRQLLGQSHGKVFDRISGMTEQEAFEAVKALDLFIGTLDFGRTMLPVLKALASGGSLADLPANHRSKSLELPKQITVVLQTVLKYHRQAAPAFLRQAAPDLLKLFQDPEFVRLMPRGASDASDFHELLLDVVDLGDKQSCLTLMSLFAGEPRIRSRCGLEKLDGSNPMSHLLFSLLGSNQAYNMAYKHAHQKWHDVLELTGQQLGGGLLQLNVLPILQDYLRVSDMVWLSMSSRVHNLQALQLVSTRYDQMFRELFRTSAVAPYAVAFMRDTKLQLTDWQRRGSESLRSLQVAVFGALCVPRGNNRSRSIDIKHGGRTPMENLQHQLEYDYRASRFMIGDLAVSAKAGTPSGQVSVLVMDPKGSYKPDCTGGCEATTLFGQERCACSAWSTEKWHYDRLDIELSPLHAVVFYHSEMLEELLPIFESSGVIGEIAKGNVSVKYVVIEKASGKDSRECSTCGHAGHISYDCHRFDDDTGDELPQYVQYSQVLKSCALTSIDLIDVACMCSNMNAVRLLLDYGATPKVCSAFTSDIREYGESVVSCPFHGMCNGCVVCAPLKNTTLESMRRGATF